jgi:sugar-specific transcriptional regulator TrmB
MNIIQKLKNNIGNLHELADEKKELEERRARALREIAEAGQNAITDKIEMRILRASNVVTICNSRLAHLESGSADEAAAIREIYMAARASWNKACDVRRELARAEFLTANLRFFDNSEEITATRLAGVMTPALVRMARAGWNLMLRPDDSPFAILQQVETFIGHVERLSKETGIPID